MGQEESRLTLRLLMAVLVVELLLHLTAVVVAVAQHKLVKTLLQAQVAQVELAPK